MFTENYIEMVSKAKEIQKLCKYNKGDWFIDFGDLPKKYGKHRFEVLSRELNYKTNLFKYFRENTKWLPTLEDLFGMIDKDIEEGNLEDFMMWCRLFVTPENIKENALDYIMEVYYSKEWNPEKKEWEEM